MHSSLGHYSTAQHSKQPAKAMLLGVRRASPAVLRRVAAAGGNGGRGPSFGAAAARALGSSSLTGGSKRQRRGDWRMRAFGLGAALGVVAAAATTWPEALCNDDGGTMVNDEKFKVRARMMGMGHGMGMMMDAQSIG